jgi:hypothetical protein
MSKYIYKNLWRGAVSVLLLLAIIGPWWFDRINVPAQYPCNRPVVRLEGDFCGMPMSGIWIFAIIGSRLIELFKQVSSGNTAVIDSISMILLTCLYLAYALCLLLPLISPWLLILKGENKRVHWLQVFSLGIAVCITWLLGFNLMNPQKSLALWGSWLYLGVVIVALIVEVFMQMVGTKFSQVSQ